MLDETNNPSYKAFQDLMAKKFLEPRRIDEASFRRNIRLDKAEKNLTHKMMKKAGVEPDESGEYNMMDVVDVAHNFEQQGDPIAQKHEKVQQDAIDASNKAYARVVKIADALKERNPDLYMQYYKQKKDVIFQRHSKVIDKLTDTLTRLKRLNAPQVLIQNAQKSLDDSAGRLHQIAHFEVGLEHKKAMEGLYRPR